MVRLPTQTTTSKIVVGSLVWLEDPEVAWIDGEVVKISGEDITVNLTSGKTVCGAPLIYKLSIFIVELITTHLI